MKRIFFIIMLCCMFFSGNSQSVTTTYSYTWKYDTVYQTQTGQKDFAYTGSAQSYTLSAGTYTLEVWGAQGGKAYYSSTSYGYGYGGKGGYAKGIYTAQSPITFYICVGGEGTNNR